MSAALRAASADAPYWSALAAGRLELPRCVGCGQWLWPARFRCSACGDWHQLWQKVKPAGAVFAWTRTWHQFGGTEDIGTPFVTAVVVLDDAPVRLMGIVDGNPDRIAIGDRVTGVFATTSFERRAVPALHWRLEAAP